MDDELTPEQKFAAESAETMVPRQLLAGRAVQDVEADLIRLDWSPAAAHALVARVLDDLRKAYGSPANRERLAAEAHKQVVGGLALAILGALITVFSTVLYFMYLLRLGIPVTLLLVGFGLFVGGFVILGRGRARLRLLRHGNLPFERSEPSPRVDFPE